MHGKLNIRRVLVWRNGTKLIGDSQNNTGIEACPGVLADDMAIKVDILATTATVFLL